MRLSNVRDLKRDSQNQGLEECLPMRREGWTCLFSKSLKQRRASVTKKKGEVSVP